MNKEYEKSDYTDTLGDVLQESDLLPADVILSLADGVISHGIAAFTGGDYSHVQAVAKLIPAVTNVVQAVKEGVDMPEYSKWREHLDNPAVVMRRKYIWESLSPEGYALFNKTVLELQGTKYGYEDIANIFFNTLSGRDIANARPNITVESLCCSHLSSRLIRESLRYDIAPGIPDYLTTPNDIFRSESMEIVGHILPIVWPREKEDDEMSDSLDEGSV